MEEKVEKDNVVYIGSKPFINYITGVMMQFTSQKKQEVSIRARGKFITKAVDIAEVIKRRFSRENNIRVKEIKIDSEKFENSEGKEINVSTIDILLAKN